MKTISNAIYSFLHSLGQATTAAHFARLGNYRAAQAIYRD